MSYWPAGGPEVDAWRGGRGFTVHYGRISPEVLVQIREYQRRLAMESPGWTSQVETGPAGNVSLHVFALDVMPSVVLRPHEYAY